jgi:hypothetical protein
MAALVVGTLLALAALAYVLWPLIATAERHSRLSSLDAPGERAASGGVAIAEVTDDDAIEAEIRRARASVRVCPDCGPRPEPAARYCSRCGRALA